MQKPVFLTLFLFCAAALGQSAKSLESTLQKYQKAKMISMSVEKTVKSELLGKETVFKGQIQLSSGKFRWENNEPDKTILLFDGDNLINVQFPPKDFEGPVQVAKSKVDQKSKNQILISSLLSPRSTKSKFKVLNEKVNNSSTDFELSPEGQGLQVKDLVIRITSKTKEIQEISYKDDVGNFTKMAFSDIKFLKKAKPEIFKYKIPKGAQVTNL